MSGAFLNNAKRWPGYGRASGMRCVIARQEWRFCVFAEGADSLSQARSDQTTALESQSAQHKEAAARQLFTQLLFQFQ